MTGRAEIPVRHHPSEETLVAHAAGGLWSAATPVVAFHLSRCPECRARVAMAEAVGGALLDALPPAPLAHDALRSLMDRLDRGAADAAAPPAAAGPASAPGGAGALAATLRRLGLPFPPLRWVAPGLRHAVVARDPEPGGGTLRLLRVRPGSAIVRHAHAGAELTCVLEGAFADETGRYGPGDLAEADASLSHRPVAEGPPDCVCLVATQGGVRLGGLFGRLVGPLFS
jgi:putative transcriptional regulator